MLDLFDFFGYLAQLFLVLFNVKTGYSADRQSKKFIDILFGDIAQKLFSERSKTVKHLLVLFFDAFALFDTLVDTVLEENLCERLGMAQLIHALKLDLKLPFDVAEEFLNVALQHLRHGHLHRLAVTNDHKFRRHPDRTVGVHIESLQHLFRILTFGRSHSYFHSVSGEILNTGNFDLVFLPGFFNGFNQCFRRAGCGDLFYDQNSAVSIYLRPQSYSAVAVFVFPDIHQSALLEIRVKVKRLALEFAYFSIQQLVEVVGQNRGGHTDRNTITAEHQQTGNFGRKQNRLLFAPVVVWNKIGNVIVEHCFIGKKRQRTLGITRGSCPVAGKQVSEVSLSLDKVRITDYRRHLFLGFGVVDHLIAAAAFVGKHHDGIADGSISVRMIVHGVTDDIGGFGGTSVFVRLIKCPHNAPLDRLQSVIDIRDGTRTDNIARVIQKVAIHHLAEKVIGSFAFFSHSSVFDTGSVIHRINGIDLLLITHSQQPPDSALYTLCAREYFRPCKTSVFQALHAYCQVSPDSTGCFHR